MLAYTLAYPGAFPGLPEPFNGLPGPLLLACNAAAGSQGGAMPVFTVRMHSTGLAYSVPSLCLSVWHSLGMAYPWRMA